MPLRFFLIVTCAGVEEASVEDLGTDSERAMSIYRDRERSTATEPGVDVVLLSSQSEETLRRTHSSYFGAARGLGDVLHAG
jgi:hypothetical protein